MRLPSLILLPGLLLGCTSDAPTVILFSIDGTSAALIEEEWDNLPVLSSLAEEGSYAPATLRGASDTRAGHALMLTGYTAEVTGVHSAADWTPIPEGLSIQERIHDAYGRDVRLAFIAGKPAMLGFEEGEAFYHAAQVCARTSNHGEETDELGARMVKALRGFGRRSSFSFFHFAAVDWAGHRSGERSTRQREALRGIDHEIGVVLDELGGRDVTVLVSSDHGFEPGTNTHQHYANNVWVLSNRPLQGVEAQDQVAWTVLDLYGLGTAPGLPEPDYGSMLSPE